MALNAAKHNYDLATTELRRAREAIRNTRRKRETSSDATR